VLSLRSILGFVTGANPISESTSRFVSGAIAATIAPMAASVAA
jgi:hypothetical protein